MYGIQCDGCRKFVEMEKVKNWGKIVKVSNNPSFGMCMVGSTEFYYCPDCMVNIRKSWEDE